jgi:hypothetical protein
MAGNLADIALGSFTGVRNMRQQRFDNDAKTRQLGQIDRELKQQDRTQDQKDRELGQGDTQLTINDRIAKVSESAEQRSVDAAGNVAVTTGNDQYIDTLNSAGLLSPDMLSLSKDKFRSGIEGGDATINKVALDIITKSGELPQGSVASNIQALPDGRYAITVTNADGSMGAITEDTSSTPQSKVVEFEAGRLTNLGNLYYQTKVANNSSLISATRIRAELGRVNSDAERNEILKKYENIQQKAAVLDNTPAEGGASRQVAGVLAEADDDVLSAVTNDIAPEENKVATRKPAGEENAAAKLAGVSEDNAVASEYSRLIESPQASRETGRSGAMTFTADQAGPASLSPEEYIQKQRDSLKSLESVNSSKSPALTKRIEDKKEFLKAIDESKKEAFPAEITESEVAINVAGKTTQEVDAAIESGEIKPTPEEAQQVALSMKDAGITKLAEMLRLNDKDRAVARAVIISMETDPTRRRGLSDEINSIFESSRGTASVSLKDEMDLDLENRKLAYNNKSLTQTRANFVQKTKEWETAQYKTALDESAAWTEATNKVWFGEEGKDSNLNAKTARMVFRRHMPQMMLKAVNSATPEDAKVRFKAVGGVLGTAIAAMAQEDEGGFIETFISFTRDEAEDNVSAMDFDLSRVRPVYKTDPSTRKKTVVAYYYMDAQGKPLSERIMADEFAAIDAEMEKIIRTAAIYNDNKKEG